MFPLVMLVAIAAGVSHCPVAVAVQGSPRENPPAWVSPLLEGGSSCSTEQGLLQVVTGPQDSREAARKALFRSLEPEVSRFLIRAGVAADQIPAENGWSASLLRNEEIWIGPVEVGDDPDRADEDSSGVARSWRGVARVPLNDLLVERQRLQVHYRKLLVRIEEVLLGLFSVAGSVAIVWACLVLDHKTRHHFSRRFQTLAVAVWLLFGAGVVVVWWVWLL